MIFAVANQTPTINVVNLTATNLTVTGRISTSDGAFTRATVIGYMPNNFLGSLVNDIHPFMKASGLDSALGEGYLMLPPGATIIQCTLSNNGETLSPGATTFRVYTSTQLNILPVQGTSIPLYTNPAASDINAASVLVVKDTTPPDAIGGTGLAPPSVLTLEDHCFVLLTLSDTITIGDVRITIQYDTPVVAG
jgi:hypothetical protein